MTSPQRAASRAGIAAFVIATCAGTEAAQQPRTTELRITITAGSHRLHATLADNATAHDFAGLLPLTLTMADLFGREKYGRLPRALSQGGVRERSYSVGQIVYWPPGPDVAIFYRNDGQAIPAPGTVVLGKIEANVDRLNAPGPVTVTIAREY